MAIEDNNLYSGEKIHRVKRSQELSPEILSIQKRQNSTRGIYSPLLIFYGLIFLIILGTIGLSLPFSKSGLVEYSFVDYIFVSTSAVTVTGLVPFDTELGWTLFGQSIILFLSFIGGIGFMVGAGFLLLIITGRKLNLEQRLLIREGLSDSSPTKLETGNTPNFLLNVVYLAIIFQIVGIIMLYFLMGENIHFNDYGRIYNSIFHSVSAFNGSGFDIINDANGGSIGSITGDSYFLIITMVLIFFGSIGYPIVFELLRNTKMASLSKFKEIHLSLNSKIVIIATFLILIFGSAQFLFGEWNNTYTIYGSSFNSKITHSIFHAITRTAGFSLIDYDLIHNSTTFTTIVLMLIGGSSLSVAGGIKVGTLTVIIVALISNIRGGEEVTIFKRTISAQVVRRSFVIFVFSIILLSVGFIIMASFEPDNLFKELLFESVSAFGNVGLSTGITKDLNHLSKIILSILMIIGRFGPLLLATLLLGNKEQGKIRQPYESVRIG